MSEKKKGIVSAFKSFAFKDEEGSSEGVVSPSNGSKGSSDRTSSTSKTDFSSGLTRSPEIKSPEINRESEQFFNGIEEVVKNNTKDDLSLFIKQFDALSMIPDIKTRLQAALSSAQAASATKLSPKNLTGGIDALCNVLDQEQRDFDSNEESRLNELTQKNSGEIESLNEEIKSLKDQEEEIKKRIEDAEKQKSEKTEKNVLLQKKRAVRKEAFTVALNKHLKRLTDLKELINQLV